MIQLLAIDRKTEEEDVVVITLRSLPKSYEHFIETLNITSSSVDLQFTDLCTLLLEQDWWKQQFGSNSSSTSTEQAFAAKSFQRIQASFNSHLNRSLLLQHQMVPKRTFDATTATSLDT